MPNVDLSSVRASIEILAWTKARQAALKQLEEQHRALVEEAMGENEIGQLDGHTVVTWTHGKKNQFQQKKMKEVHPELVAEFTELVTSRTFKVVETE